MKKLYEEIYKLDTQKKNILFTVLDGTYFGSKILLSDNHIIYEENADFLKEHIFDLKKISKSGKSVLAGTTIFTEIFENDKKLYVCGGGHCAIQIIKLAKTIGMKVTVLEDREEFAENGRVAGADEVLLGKYTDSFEKIPGDNDSYFVVVTRGHLSDKMCVSEALKKKHAYCGMIGSKKHAQVVLDALKSEGFDPNLVDSVYAPIGLNINAETPEEVAVSIMAQVIQVKNKVRGTFGVPQKLLNQILGILHDEHTAEIEFEPMVMATIVGRSGSGPRQEGCKMLVQKDGSIAGTVGGGGMEAQSIKEAVSMLEKSETKSKILYFEMTNQSAYKEGMVCGGTADGLLEVIR